MFQMFCMMIAAHALADYPLQGDFLARAKNHRAPIIGVPWYQALAAHAIIHGTFVGIIAHSIPLAMAETVAHAGIDYLKSDSRIDFNTDQILHVGCKVVWCVVILMMVTAP